MKTATTALMLIGLFASTGCQPEGDEWPRAAVQGKVTLDGKPLPSGNVTFFPAGGTKGPAAGAEIVDGQYALDAYQGPVVGKSRIEIRSVQKTGRLVPAPSAIEMDGAPSEGMLVEEFLDVVPKQYNTYSQLEREITDGENQIDFELQTPPQAASSSR